MKELEGRVENHATQGMNMRRNPNTLKPLFKVELQLLIDSLFTLLQAMLVFLGACECGYGFPSPFRVSALN